MSTAVATIPAPSSPDRTRPSTLSVIALVVAVAAAVLAVVGLAARDTSSVVQQPATQSQSLPSAGPASRYAGPVRNLDACGRPIVTSRAACR